MFYQVFNCKIIIKKMFKNEHNNQHVYCELLAVFGLLLSIIITLYMYVDLVKCQTIVNTITTLDNAVQDVAG